MRNPFRRSLRSAAGDDSLDSSAVHTTAAVTDAPQARLQRASQTSLPAAPVAVCPFEEFDVIEETGAALDAAATERSSMPRSSSLRKTDKPVMTSSQSAYNVCANDEAVESDGEASVRHGCLRRSRKQVRIRTSRS